MIAQSHINTVNLALFAPTTAHDSLCQFGLRPRRKPFPVVPGWSEAARPGVLCSHSLWGAGRVEPPRLLSAGAPSDCVTPWPHLAAPLPYIHLFNTATTYSWQQQNESWLAELQTPHNSYLSLTSTHHNCCLALYSPCTFILRKCPITACVGPYMLQAETDRMQCGKCFSLSPSPPPSQWKHHGILTCCSATSPENSL